MSSEQMSNPATDEMTESMIKLYTFQLCPFAHRVRLALAEKGVAAEPIEIDLRNKPATFPQVSPHGRVPLLLHGEVKLWESAIINEYLDEAFPDPPLMPESLPDRALARIWIKFADEWLYASTHSLIFAREKEARQKLVARMLDALWFLENEVMAKRRGTKPYLFGDRFTLADISLYPWFEQVGALEQLSEFRLPLGCGGLSEWRCAVSGRKAVAQCARTSDWYVERYRSYLVG
jgi:glutathione S-transferase